MNEGCESTPCCARLRQPRSIASDRQDNVRRAVGENLGDSLLDDQAAYPRSMKRAVVVNESELRVANCARGRDDDLRMPTRTDDHKRSQAHIDLTDELWRRAATSCDALRSRSARR